MKNTLLCLLVVVAAVGPPVAAVDPGTDNEAPVVDAGLDQSVVRGSVVYLDAGGSYDPDGEIRSYEWSIRAPNGTTLAPDCPDCERTSFTPVQTGTYEVTVAATDDDGATANDTLYVRVSNGSTPSVSLSTTNRTADSGPVDVVASARSGNAPLDSVAWYVDGERTRVVDVAGDRARTSIELPSNRSGPTTVRAVVVDRVNRRASASTRVLAGTDGVPGDPSNDSANRSTGPPVGGVVEDAYVQGPRLLTGSEPLAGTYDLVVEGRNVSVESVEWRVDGRTVATGSTVDLTFSPGNHSLRALVLTETDVFVVGFADGSTTVVADPPPDVFLDSLSVDGRRVSGSATATDAYGNLRRVRVLVGNTTVATAPPTAISVRDHDRLRADFDRSFAPNGTYTVRVVAVDHRGQSRSVERSVTTGGGSDNDSSNSSSSPDSEPRSEADPNPTVLSSEFVDGPVDSYHERIDPDRYLAEHVTRIDLDGADPGDVTVVFNNRDDDLRYFDGRTEKRYDAESDLLVVRSYLSGTSPQEYGTTFLLTHNGTVVERFESTFEVTPSDPEARLDVERAGTEYDTGRWGMVVDASDSFDPDGSEIEFDWGGGTQSLSESGVAKMSSRETASLTIHTQDGGSTTVDSEFLNYFNPGLDTVERTTVDRITEEGTVYVRVTTPVYAFTKSTYDADLSVEVIGDGDVIEWQNVERGTAGGSSGSTEDPLEQYYTGIVAIDRDEVGDGPEIRIYNDAEPHVTAVTYSVSEESGAETESYARRNITVQSVRYEVNDSTPESVETASPDERDAYVDDGYEVREVVQEDVAYRLERKEEVTERRTEQRTFDTRRSRRLFVRTSSEWRSAGTVETTETETVTETVWREDRGGPGEFTGETRRRVVGDGPTVTEREFVAQRTETVEVVEREVVVTPSGPKTVDTTVEKTVQRERRYWARVPDSSHHTPTGRTREVPLDGAVTTEYQYRVDRTRQRSVERFAAERTVTESVTEWQSWKTVDASLSNLNRIRSGNDVRIADTVQRTKWRLVRNGSGTRISETYDRETAVNRTIVYVSGELIRNDLEDGTTEVVDDFRVRLTFDGALSRDEILERIAEREGEAPCSGDERIAPGCDDYKDDD